MKNRFALAAALLLGAASTGALAQGGPAYRYSGPHAGGPADALIPDGPARPVVRTARPAAYRYSGPHAGGPADDLIPNGPGRTVMRPARPAAYRYAGSHAGGPANGLQRD